MFWDPAFEHLSEVSGAPPSQVKVSEKLAKLIKDHHCAASLLSPCGAVCPSARLEAQHRACLLAGGIDFLPCPFTGARCGVSAPHVQLRYGIRHSHNT